MCRLLPPTLALFACCCASAQTMTSQHISASAAGADFRARRTVAVTAVSRDPHTESAEHMEKLRTVGLGAVKGTVLEAVHHGKPAQLTLQLTTIPKTAQGGPITTILLLDNASGKPLYCASEIGMEEHSAARQLFTQFNAVLNGLLAVPSPDSMDVCVANAGTGVPSQP